MQFLAFVELSTNAMTQGVIFQVTQTGESSSGRATCQ
jgi:hypothetical protein